MSENLSNVREKQGEGREICVVNSHRNLIVAAQQSSLTVLHSYCNSFFVRDVRGEFGLINVYLFEILSAISFRKLRGKWWIFFCLESGNPVLKRERIFLSGGSQKRLVLTDGR